MYKDHLKIAFRAVRKNKTHTLINIVGLGVGIAATILILLYVQVETGYDRFHNNTDRIYRLSFNRISEAKTESESPVYTPPVGPDMLAEFAEVENYTRIATPRRSFFRYDDQPYKINRIIYADSTFLDLFAFAPNLANKKQTLVDPYSIVLTRSTATRIFGERDPTGERLLGNDQKFYNITAVIDDPPGNSHLNFNALISFSTFYTDTLRWMGWDGGNQYITYIKLKENATTGTITPNLPDFLWPRINEKTSAVGSKVAINFQPLEDLHLYYDNNGNNLRNLIVLSIIGLLILAMACINFVNITISHANSRMKEVGIRKVFGADKQVLFRQFIVESMLITFLALLLALLLLELTFPFYATLIPPNLQLLSITEISHVAGLVFILLVISFAAGSYPALYISSFPAAHIVKGVFYPHRVKSKLRNSLVVFQVATSVVLIICTLFINNQLNFMNNKELGYHSEDIVYIPLVDRNIKQKALSFRDELTRLPKVLGAAASSNVPYNGFTSNGYIPEGLETSLQFHVVVVDDKFIETFGLTLAGGRNFREGLQNESGNYIVNETLAKSLNWENPLGKTLRRNGNNTIVGVVEDFHFASLYETIKPLVIIPSSMGHGFRCVSVRLQTDDISTTLADIDRIWKQFAPDTPMEYQFLDQSIERLYYKEQLFQTMLLSFSIIALLIALLGAYSQVSFAVAKKTKEIGVRKVLGATTTRILVLISKEFMYMVAIGNLIAWPTAYLILSKWQQNFAYSAGFSVLPYLYASLIVLAIVLVTVSLRSIHAALSNPIDAIRYE